MRLWRWLVMVLSVSGVNAVVATVTRFRVLKALVVIMNEILGKMVRI